MMDYDAVLAQVLALLQREQRVAYRVLKRRLQLDDEILADLKDDLIYAKKVAVDEEGRVLVWTGVASKAPTTASPVPLSAVPDVSPAHGEVSPGAPPPDAERRQLTVMFCDLVDSTALSGQLDPEDLRDVVQAYQQVCAAVITRFDGHIAQYLGDGLLVYFGYPLAHEDDAVRAVRAGLGILAAMDDLNQGLTRAQGIQLDVRVGLHTGLVVVGAMGSMGRHEQLALGETPNIAARIQGMAAPNTVTVSDPTSRLVQGYFDCQDLGAQTLRGVAAPVAVHRVLQESGARSRLDVAVVRGLTPLVGREQEVGLLFERWEQVNNGHGHVVLLTGEPGIGKSRLVQMLKDHVAHQPHVRWECRSVPYYQNTALFPLVDLFQRIFQFAAQETPHAKLEKLEHALSQYRLSLEESVPLFASLLALPLPANRYPLLHLSPQRQRQKTLEIIITILLELAESQPVLFIVEDLHWTDPSTLELLNLVLDHTPTASLLTVLTCRPTFQPSWTHRSYLTEMSVTRLAQPQIARMVQRVAGEKTLPTEVLQQIMAKTDGVPLFVEEMTKAVLESGALMAVDAHYELTGSLSTLAIPATLQDSLMARLDRLVTAKAVAQYAAVIGRHFSYALLQAVSPVGEVRLQHELGRLVEAEIIYQRGVPPHATYRFKHALIQEAAYQSLLRSTRQQYHQRIAQVLATRFPALVETQPELVAQHCTEAGLTEQAVGYWQRAGERAIQHSAYMEASSHLSQALARLQTLPETDARDRQELDVQLALGRSLMATKGLGAVDAERAYRRTWDLCQHVEAPAQQRAALAGLRRMATGRGDMQTTRALAEQLLRLAQRQQDTPLLLEAHYSLGVALQQLGEVAAARTQFERGITLDQHPSLGAPITAQQVGIDPSVGIRTHAGRMRWIMGYPEQAMPRDREALALAEQRADPYSQGFALMWSAILYAYRRESQRSQQQAEAVIALATAHEFETWWAMGMTLCGWSRGIQGHHAEGLAQLQQGLSSYQASGQVAYRAYSLYLLAEIYGQAGHPEAGLCTLATALTTMATAGDQHCKAEVYRLQGELLQQVEADVPHAGPPEACFHRALAIARQQQAKSFELRAAMSLARLWQQQGKRAEARELLAPIYGWFTEGFDTADLQEARTLLEALA